MEKKLNERTFDELKETIDNEISRLIKSAESNAIRILEKYKEKLHNLADALLDIETLNSDQFINIINDGYVTISPPIEPSLERRVKRKRRSSALKNKEQD